jgi:hypothetical protein
MAERETNSFWIFRTVPAMAIFSANIVWFLELGVSLELGA